MEFFVVSLIKTAMVFAVLMTTLAYLQWIERKVLAHIQLRLGPQRVGPHGLLQPLADVIKLATKEGVIPKNVNTFFYVLAPVIAVALALISIVVIPFGPGGVEVPYLGIKTNMGLADLNIGVLFILAVSSVGVYGIALGGWASNNKYSLMGGLRSSAQMISYELPMSIALATPLLALNSLNLREIVEKQGGFALGFIPQWTIFQFPPLLLFAFVIFLISAFAETNRVPFDLPEAENELVAGFHTEYSSLAFAGFFMAEYANMITVTCLAATLFLGGWQPLIPGVAGHFVPSLVFFGGSAVLLFHGLTQPFRKWDRYTFPFFGLVFGAAGLVFLIPVLQPYLVPVFWFAAKVGVLLFVFIWIRGTLPRFRYDQLMKFTWTFLFPAAMILLTLTALWVALT
jgi:NADH-quinone oxidoreductase subunit H